MKISSKSCSVRSFVSMTQNLNTISKNKSQKHNMARAYHIGITFIKTGNPKEYILLNKAIKPFAILIPLWGTKSTTILKYILLLN